MSPSPIETARLRLVARTLAEVRLSIAGLDADQRAHVSADWLARVESGTADHWTLGFSMVHRANGVVVGTCGFKGPAGADGIVEIAYGVEPEFRRQGYATEAAAALVAFAFGHDRVRVVRAHTLLEPNASTRVLTRCGFQLVGEVVDPEDGPVWRWEISTAR